MNWKRSIALATALLMSGSAALSEESVFGALINCEQATESQLSTLKAKGFTGAVLYLLDGENKKQQAAARQLLESGLTLYYWIEVARNPGLADRHPEWMASVQTHTEWRRDFPKFPKESSSQVVKVYPWVPMLYKEAFPAHLERIRGLLQGLPAARALFLNDLQGAPSACGCGNNLCRWTTDYGSRTTATLLEPGAAADFVDAVRKLTPDSRVIPVWTTECDEHDASCGGVPCFTGRCWKEYAKQIAPLERHSERIGVIVPQARVADAVSIQSPQVRALNSFGEVLPANGGPAISSDRLIAVLPGPESSDDLIKRQFAACKAVGVKSIVVSYTPIDQSWEPRLFDLKK